MRHLGPDAEKIFADEAAYAGLTPDRATRFTALWRKFMIQELTAYRAEAKTAPRLPRLPDHAASEKALVARTRDALAGNLAAPPAPPAPPRAKPIADAPATQKKIDDILGELH